MRRLVAFLGLWALAPACGGQVEGGGSGSNPDPGSSARTKTTPTGASAPIDNPDADTELGDCMLGPKEYADPDKPCAWVADGRCYDRRAMACNCACPRSRNSQCASGFEGGPDAHVWVDCE